MKFLRSPMVQFLFIGIIIYMLYGWVLKQKDQREKTTLVISVREVAVSEPTKDCP
jgi:hypothetical protein